MSLVQRRGFFAGLEAAMVVSLLMVLGRAAGLAINLELALGALVTGGEGLGTWMLGFGLHLALGGLMGQLYLLLLERTMPRRDVLAGLYLGMVHAMPAGFLLGALDGLVPRLPAVPPMGPFLSALGPRGVIGFFLLHAVFGVVVVEVLGRRSNLAGALRDVSAESR